MESISVQGEVMGNTNEIFRMETPFVVSIVDALHLMLGLGTFIVTLLGVVIAIIKIDHKK